LFDGVCNLCHRSVDFIRRRDPDGKFKFIHLQSPVGKDMIRMFGVPDQGLDSILFIEDCKIYDRSTGSLSILRELGWPWKIFYVFMIVPRPIRDFFYDIIAKYRYRWFGRNDICEV